MEEEEELVLGTESAQKVHPTPEGVLDIKFGGGVGVGVVVEPTIESKSTGDETALRMAGRTKSPPLQDLGQSLDGLRQDGVGWKHAVLVRKEAGEDRHV